MRGIFFVTKDPEFPPHSNPPRVGIGKSAFFPSITVFFNNRGFSDEL
jgi:hypothetical protein